VDGRVDLRDKVIPILVFLQATKSHFRAGDVLLGVLKVLKLLKGQLLAGPEAGPEAGSLTDKSIFIPCNPLCFVGVCV